VPPFPEDSDGIEHLIHGYAHLANADFRLRQKSWAFDLNKINEQQTILSILARQTTLAIEIVSNPGTWNSNISPILLRAMADVHITLVWILEDPETRVQMYVKDGLGSIKLEIAHRRKEFDSLDANSKLQHEKYTESLENWLEAQQLTFLTDVNLGSWSGKNTRVMAKEANCSDFYNFVFQPFSAAVHSHWSHVGRINVEYCQNPAHNFHLLPVVPSFYPDPHWAHLAGKYLGKSLDAFDLFLGRDDLAIHSYPMLCEAFTDEADSKGANQQATPAEN